MTNYNNKKPVAVTWDYSDKSEFALLHAIDIANALNREIVLIHISKSENDVALNIERLNLKAEDVMEKYGIRPSVIVKTGNIFDEIKNAIEECNAEVAVMGTHGMKGIQKFTGSWALKVIAGSKAPFVVVQDKPPVADIHKIVVPLDFKAEEKEKLVWTDFINKIFFKCKFYLCYTESNDTLIYKRTQNNINAAVKYLENKSINYELQRLDGKNGFAQETVQFAENIGSGLIITMTTKNIRFQDYVFGAVEQQIIANQAKIPVMCVNPMD